MKTVKNYHNCQKVCSTYKIQENVTEKVLDLTVESSKAGRYKSNTKQSIVYDTSAINNIGCKNSTFNDVNSNCIKM